MLPTISFKHLIQILACCILPILLLIALSERIAHAYLEDDLLWFIPFISQIITQHSPLEIFKILHTNELSFLYGVYFSSMISLFGFNFGNYVIVSIFIHFLNTVLFYVLLKKGIKLTSDTSFLASLIYFVFYGHFHVYTWPLSSHHLLVMLFLFLILSFYLKADDLIERDQYFTKYYWITLFLSGIASFQRLSILIIPLMIFIHILFSTKENKKIYIKYNLWLPLFIVFSIYPLTILILGGQGDVLNGFLGPLYDIFGSTKNPFIVSLVVIFCLSGFFVVKYLLQRFLKNRPSDYFFSLLSKLSFVLLLMPQIFFLGLYIFLWAPQSALSDQVVMRWQGIAMPRTGYGMGIGLIFTLVIILCFLRHMIKNNRRLIIFIPWYMMLLPFLSGFPDFIYSRYLIYIAPIFGVMLCLFFVELLPKVFAQKWQKRSITVFYICILMFSVVNLLSIKIRSMRTLLVDHHWGYDYIKIARLIKQDMQSAKDTTPSLDNRICVSGLRDIPYKQSWEKGFLRQFDFSRFDPFRQTLASVLKKDTTEMIINEPCPDDVRFSYTVNDVTVHNQNNESVEPFYQLFEESLQLLKERNHIKAITLLEEAVKQKPFLIQFMGNSFAFREEVYDLLMQKAADAIYETYAGYYDGDEKINYIDNMVRIEAQDYGMALALLSYLKSKENLKQESRRLLNEAALFVPPEEIEQYLLDRYFPDSEVNKFRNFIANNNLIFLSKKRPNFGIIVESYKGFNIVWHKDFYFAWPKDQGDFRLAKFKNENHEGYHSAKTKHELRGAIDSVLAEGDNKGKKSVSASAKTMINYRNFDIKQSGEMYFCSLGNKPLFEARSLLEARLAIDTLLNM